MPAESGLTLGSLMPEFGHFALIIAWCFSALLLVLPLVGAYRNNILLMRSSRSLSHGMFFFVLLSFISLTYSFLHDDFSVAYVASHSNSLLPWYYKMSAVWGGHEGSLLLWILMLAGWTSAVAFFSKSLPLAMQSRVLAVMGFVAVGFMAFILITSNPFNRLLPISPADGSDLNPLLQDIGLILHPPILYMGYVGFSVTFAFAIAALLTGRLDAAWARWSRPWTILAWGFLSIGIALGSWWAYYELGWGGWWFWDPVENASFMPWLAGTALIHSLAVTEKRGMFKSWTILLAIFAFSLSLLGTFLVRSGVLTSVHAFANDPERGIFILGFLIVVVGVSLTLFALRAPVVRNSTEVTLLSRETFLFANNILLMIALLAVLTGTLYPLVADVLKLGKISVGPPFFNTFFVPIILLLGVLIGIGPLTNWKKTKLSVLRPLMTWPAIASLLVGFCLPVTIGDAYSVGAAIALTVALWILFTFIADLLHRVRHAKSFMSGLQKLSLSYFAMAIAHLGIAAAIVGASFVTVYSDHRDLRMDLGKTVSLNHYDFTLEELRRVEGPNYIADEAVVRVTKNGKLVTIMKPQKRRYLASGSIMTEVALDPGLFRDLYVAMGERLNDSAWAMRVHVKTFVRWVWLGVIMMGIGALLAVADKRYRRREAGEAT